jgi:hypothetical protein
LLEAGGFRGSFTAGGVTAKAAAFIGGGERAQEEYETEGEEKTQAHIVGFFVIDACFMQSVTRFKILFF